MRAVVTIFTLMVVFALAGGRPRSRAQSTGGPERHQDCVRNLKLLSLAFSMYAQDNDEQLPPMESAREVRRLLRPYTRFLAKSANDAVFVCPETGALYKPNAALSEKPWKGMRDDSVLLRDAKPHPGRWEAPGGRTGKGYVNVLYRDSRVGMVPTPP